MRIYPTQTPDSEFASLGTAGFTGTLNDRQFAFLRDDGKVGSLADMIYDWTVNGSEGGGDPTYSFLGQSINANGWSGTYASPPTFDPVGSPERFTVTRNGFTTSGGATTYTDDLLTMKRLRQPYINHASLTTDQVVLQDFIYSGEAITGGATNNSTLVYPRPICMWMKPDLERATTNYTARVAVAHMYARSGKPVAAVKFVLTDGTTTVEQVVSTMSTWVSVESGFSVPCYEHTFSLSGFTANVALSLDLVVYPWVGASYDTRVSGAAAPSISFGTTRVFNDVSYGTAYVYVDAVLGNNTTGIASQTAAAAAALPFLNISNACTALRTYNNANFGRDHVSGGVIRLVVGTHTYQTLNSTPTGTMGDLPVVIEAVGGYAARATTILQDNGASGTASPARAIFRNLTLYRTFVTNLNFLNASAGIGSQTFTVFDACKFDVGSGTGTNTAWIGAIGRSWAIDCITTGAIRALDYSSTTNKVTNVIGGVVNGGISIYNTVGARHVVLGTLSDAAFGAGNREAQAGIFLGFNHFTRGDASTAAVGHYGHAIGAEGFAFVGNVAETTANAQPTLQIAADGQLDAVQNIVIQQNSIVGDRVNFGYQDTGTTTIAKSASCRNNVFSEFNSKSDVFGAHANLIGNWPIIFKVAHYANSYIYGSSDTDTPGTGVWVGELAEIGAVNGSNASPITAAWNNDQSVDGGGAGGGDYRPGVSTTIGTVPAGFACYPIDHLGKAIPDNGTAKQGALQPA